MSITQHTIYLHDAVFQRVEEVQRRMNAAGTDMSFSEVLEILIWRGRAFEELAYRDERGCNCRRTPRR